ncbi:Up-regulated during septation-domain-containing protein [Cercophora scortea]|uniref:Up-regulated during septation-domain-containing protein n=1 Tax=Cercophora scortea TaxID=314031 RepID=A0AAE0M7H1_9PEZI|nr:Up-regulated during septation-domain-containing protein [Cercophora scortea]
MNGATTRKPSGSGFDVGAGRLPPAPNIIPNKKVLMEGYRNDLVTGFDRERPPYEEANTERRQSSALVDLADPIQIHLLTETALSDSKQYEILSQEEVDDLKKQIQSLTIRIEQARANLAIQSKYRDAAISMAKLYSPPENKRRSLLGHRMSDSAKEAEMEKEASERRCEELAAELFTLEKRLMDPQRRLLQHTAGILQMTHRVTSKKSKQSQFGQPLPNGIPGSPESLYTYSNSRNSMEPPMDGGEFDDRSLYLPLDQMDGQSGRGRKNTIEIPLRSPIREQTTQIREAMDRIKEENAQLKAAEQQLSAERESLRAQTTGQLRIISETERKLEVLNNRLRDVIVAFNPEENGEFSAPVIATGSGDSLSSQLEYLEGGLVAAAEEQKYLATRTSNDTEDAVAAAAAVAEAAAVSLSLAQAEDRMQALTREMQNMLEQSNVRQAPPPESVEGALDEHLDYLENTIQTIRSELRRAAELSSSASAKRQDSDQVEAVLTGLWDIIQSGYAEIQKQKTTRRKARTQMGLSPDDEEDDVSSDEGVDMNEPYSLQAFSTKVQWLYAQATSLKEHKAVLQRQIKQQRDLNSKSENEKDLELKTKIDDLEKAQAMLDDSERAAREAQEQLANALDDLETLQKTSAANESAATRAVQDQLKERNATIATLESSYQDVQIRLADAETRLSGLQTQLNQANDRLAATDSSAEQLQKAIKDKDDELDRMNMMVIELKTEVAFAKAELDGAYGSRRQRAAEAAALTKSSENGELNQQIQKLKDELESTLKDFEDITRDSIKAEKEKLDLEAKLDDALYAKTSLEAEVAALKERLEKEVGRLKEQLDGERLKPPSSPAGVGGTRAGASMLSEQFRATMKEERKKFQEEMREEQARRRRLEDEVRMLKRGQGIGRSPLGPLSPR